MAKEGIRGGRQVVATTSSVAASPRTEPPLPNLTLGCGCRASAGPLATTPIGELWPKDKERGEERDVVVTGGVEEPKNLSKEEWAGSNGQNEKRRVGGYGEGRSRKPEQQCMEGARSNGNKQDERAAPWKKDVEKQ
ncbi:hypothetical protein CRG98_033213 [Punica granatum]|uniref:Uncharacterized protein n=1 Tax=Punica granatum TaxID=22663 RepID=A0A2I0IQU9_PUNGR|nr:hypothetical protein CRG98_033213 [Punica granatum]